MKVFQLRSKVPERLVDILTRDTKLPAESIQKMLEYGAVKMRFRAKGAWERVRDGRVKTTAQDEIIATFDPKILAMKPFTEATCLAQHKHYGVWFKPPGIMTQGTDAGDHTSLMFAVERTGVNPYLVHRLDRETEGLVILAYDSQGAARFSQLFQDHKVSKTYLAIVAGHVDDLNPEGTIFEPLDGKEAITHYKIVGKDNARLLVELRPVTGRLHQLRRHLELMGCGVWGDPKYGKGNKNRDGMKLAAVRLEFEDPWSREFCTFSYNPEFSRV